MAALVCEICGGKLMAKAGGLFECEYCGMQYDKTRIQEMVQEIKGTVQVEGTVEVTGTVKVEGNVSVESMLKRGYLAIEDRNWDDADVFFDKVLDINPECAEAYLGKLMAELRVTKQEKLKNCIKPFDGSSNYQKAVRFADERLGQTLEHYLDQVYENFLNLGTEGCIVEAGKLIRYWGSDTEVVLPKNVQIIGDEAFAKCENITSVIMPDGVISIGNYAFKGCQSLWHVAIPKSVISIGDYAFSDCKSLFSIAISDNVSSMGEGVFLGCEKLNKIKISEEHPVYGLKGNCFINKENKSLVWSSCDPHIPEDGSVLHIGSYAFTDCLDLTDVVIPDGIISIEEYAFASCKGLETITIPNSVTYIGHSAFCECEKLRSISIPDGVTCIEEYAFAGCKSLETVMIPNGVTHIGHSAFSGCENLKTIVIPDGASSIGDFAFSNCENLLSITIPPSVINIEKYAFNHCKRVAITTGLGTYAEQWANKCGIPIKADISSKAQLADIREKLQPAQSLVAVAQKVNIGVKSDGTVLAAGSLMYDNCCVETWHEIVAVAAGNAHTVGLKYDGSVIATRQPPAPYNHGQCNVSTWRDIVAISAWHYNTVGLKSNGTVIAVGSNAKGQCNVSGWRDIIAVAVGSEHTVGLKSDGTVLAVGSNAKGQCNVREWYDIVAIAAGSEHTVGLKSDGTVVAVGDNIANACEVNNWRNVVAISAGYRDTMGLKYDGTVMATAYDERCLAGWQNIVAISAGVSHAMGLQNDGTVVTTSYSEFEQGIRGQTGVKKWKLFKGANSLQQEQQITCEKWKQMKIWCDSGKCQHCGGELKGFLTKKCVSCGKPKDY